jgi:hypothetical protein
MTAHFKVQQRLIYFYPSPSFSLLKHRHQARQDKTLKNPQSSSNQKASTKATSGSRYIIATTAKWWWCGDGVCVGEGSDIEVV